MSKFYQVTFHEPILLDSGKTETEFHFGSVAAILDNFTIEQIGCGLKHLWNVGVSKGVTYTNNKCQIKSYELHRKKTNRGRAKK